MRSVCFKIFVVFVMLISALKISAESEVIFPEGVDEGYVIFKFDIEIDGTPTNITIIDEHPKGVFAESALKAIKKWKFKVKIVDGEPVKQYGMKYRLDFVLDE